MTPWQHFPTCSFAWTTIQSQYKWLHIKSSILLRSKWPISSWHPFRVAPLCMVSSTNWNSASWYSLGSTFWYRTTFLSLRWLCSQRSCLSLAGSVGLNGHWPKIPSCILIITLLRMGSASWVCHQSTMVIQATFSWLLWGPTHAGYKCMLQWDS